jgi:hypothetical protein
VGSHVQSVAFVVEDYINHITPTIFRLALEPQDFPNPGSNAGRRMSKSKKLCERAIWRIYASSYGAPRASWLVLSA